MGGAATAVEHCRAIIRLISTRRWPLSDEKRLQQTMADEFAAGGIVAQREVRLSGRDIIDFVVDGIGIEVKIKGSKREIYRQCERYCAHEEIRGLVLATNVAMGLPAEINGKPVFVALLGKGWL